MPMKHLMRSRFVPSACLAAAFTAAAPAVVRAQTPEPLNWTAQQDHKDMMEQLGITRLRPGPSGNASATNAANYDPAKANPFPDLPDPLVTKNGQKVTTAEQWWKVRRPEIVEDFEREVFGRVPKNVPKVTWSVVTQATDRVVGAMPVAAKQWVGQVDNAACPSIKVDIQMTLVTPANAKGPVPVLMMFGGGFGGNGFPRRAGEPAPTNRFGAFGGFGGGTNAGPSSTELLIAAGWGYATINPNSIQADNGAGLTKGIIGLVNKGQPRKPDDWGSLRAWAWGAARGLDCLETDSTVDAKKVGIEGVSRYGKAALVTLAFEPRFAVALVGSSGEGGAKLHRRNFGEAVENLTGLDGRQLPEVRRDRVQVRQQERRRPASGRPRVDRPLRAPPDLHQLRRPRPRRRQLARPAGQLHGHGGRRPRLPPAQREGHRRAGKLPHREDAAGQHRPARRRTRLAPARRRPRRPLEHETFHRLGQQAPRAEVICGISE